MYISFTWRLIVCLRKDFKYFIWTSCVINYNSPPQMTSHIIGFISDYTHLSQQSEVANHSCTQHKAVRSALAGLEHAFNSAHYINNALESIFINKCECWTNSYFNNIHFSVSNVQFRYSLQKWMHFAVNSQNTVPLFATANSNFARDMVLNIHFSL